AGRPGVAGHDLAQLGMAELAAVRTFLAGAVRVDPADCVDRYRNCRTHDQPSFDLSANGKGALHPTRTRPTIDRLPFHGTVKPPQANAEILGPTPSQPGSPPGRAPPLSLGRSLIALCENRHIGHAIRRT